MKDQATPDLTGVWSKYDKAFNRKHYIAVSISKENVWRFTDLWGMNGFFLTSYKVGVEWLRKNGYKIHQISHALPEDFYDQPKADTEMAMARRQEASDEKLRELNKDGRGQVTITED